MSEFLKNAQKPVYLKQIATVEDGAEVPNRYVFYGKGKADTSQSLRASYPAVTLSIAKKKGADAMHLSEQILHKIESIKKDLMR